MAGFPDRLKFTPAFFWVAPAVTNPDFTTVRPVLGVALDMDGLLFDTENIYWEVGQRLLAPRGKSFCSRLQQQMMGRIGVAALQEMVDFHELNDDPHDLLAESDEIYSDLLGAGPPAMPGMPELIDALIAAGIPFGVATSSRGRFANRILRAQPWFDSLTFLLTGDDVREGKPHPEMYLAAAAKMAIDASRMLVLEDSGNGSAAGVAAGAVVIAVPSPHTRTHEFPGVHAIADSLFDPVIHRLLAAE
jgi:HAD superfamily hydrolase (TIGR01509 family)